MSTLRPFAAALLLAAAAAAQSAPIHMVPFHEVALHDRVWAERVRLLRERTLPHAFANTEFARKRLRQCAEWLESGGKTEKPEPHRYVSSDLYKVLEAGALLLQSARDPAIEKDMDTAIDWIARAQQPDGYLYVSHITGAITPETMGTRPYSYVLHSHELYDVGHLYEAAVAYAQATGKTRLLDVAEKSAQHVRRVFFDGDPHYNGGNPVQQAPGHEEIELGLVKLYQQTKKREYLDTAKRFLDIRGVTFVPDGEGVNSASYAQQHQPVADQRTAQGHAVRACYLYAAMAEVDSLTGRDDYGPALDAIWHDIVDTKMHLSGGLGAVHGIEGFGPSFVLPNEHTYLETCAAVGNVFFNLRLFLKTGDGRFVDVAETALLDNCLAGLGLDGKSFFYPNPLEAQNDHAPRSAWFGTACCPSNLARLVPQVAGYLYAQRGAQVFTVLYAASETTLDVGGNQVHLTQQTDYPFDGRVALQLAPERETKFALSLRIPTWAGERPVPGALYHFLDAAPQWSLRVNGEVVEATVENGYVTLDRTWQGGDRVELTLPMPVRAVTCRPEVEADRDRLAFTRGPLLLCAEGVDNGGAVQRFWVDAKVASEATTTPIVDGPLTGLFRVSLPARALRADGADEARQLVMIPYFAWSNRDRSSMITWLPTTRTGAHPDLDDPALLKFAEVTASHTFDGDTTMALQRRATPKSSADTSIRRWTSWPEQGKPQWVELQLKQRRAVTAVSVYWYDDHGGVQVPGTWHLEALSADGQWHKVALYNTDEYSVLPDTYNTVHPAEPLAVERLRLVMTPQHERTTVGLLSVQVETED
ncbi:MAG: glycoside hydrolase family 127 protein [Planctomycetes bacterium]|nr:glycoside hydrolase family 127 protein [Planctomycetota bacterium]